MSGLRLPAPHGAWIDRTRPLRFSFNGRPIDGCAGDTVASALLAQGVMHVGRSYKLHRPRGIVSCGIEEPTGLLDIGRGERRRPGTRATDILVRDGLEAVSGNCWPSLGFDVGALNERFAAWMPAGFYYKTFMWPNWHLFEPTIRRMAAGSTLGDGADPERYDEVSETVDVLVVGAGAAGLQAARSAAAAGRRVVLLEGAVAPGGWLAAQALRGDAAAAAGRARLAARLDGLAGTGVQLRCRTTALAIYDHRLVVALESLEGDGGALRERLWKLRARQIVLATGAFERPMLFPDNDRPGVMLASAVERYAALYGVACGRRIVLAAACDAAYGVAQTLVAAGLEVAAIVERRAAGDVGAVGVPAGVRVLHESALVGVAGTRAVQGAWVAGAAGSAPQRIDADLVASAGGHAPDVSLYSQAGGRLRWLPRESMFVPAQAVPGVAVVGACAGVFDLDAALDHADLVARMEPGGTAPLPEPVGAGVVPADNAPGASALAALGRTPGRIFVDLQNDVSANDIDLAARENYRSVEHLKRYTTTGMGTDQGKTSNVNALVRMGLATGRTPDEVGTTRFRPPYKPVTLNALSAGRAGGRYRPLKRLPGHDWHAARGALFEEFGGWNRPAAYPRPGETLITAAEREAAGVRQGVGVFEASPLGKIEVYGPDAGRFLDLMYIGTLSTLPVGGARYGALLDENGIVTDDGIVARLGPNHFHVNTTSGGAERVALAFEEWLQCEYVDQRVFVVPVTAQWGNVTVSGPKAWALLQRLGFDAALAPAAMKHMTLKTAEHRGVPLRVLRASFSGEVGYEINLPASQVPALLDELWAAGQGLGLLPYGVEALMILRIEKGYLHVGADTDGTTLPGDVALARGIEKKAANFVGRRSLSRPAARDPDRLQLVGLQPVDRRTRLPVGAHLALRPPPTAAEGYVTSSCWSPALQQPIALALLRRGTQRLGETLTAWHLGTSVPVEVVKTPFVDPAGERLHG